MINIYIRLSYSRQSPLFNITSSNSNKFKNWFQTIMCIHLTSNYRTIFITFPTNNRKQKSIQKKRFIYTEWQLDHRHDSDPNDIDDRDQSLKEKNINRVFVFVFLTSCSSYWISWSASYWINIIITGKTSSINFIIKLIEFSYFRSKLNHNE